MFRTAYLALFGFLSFTIVCPITMGAMPMDMEMENMQGMSHMTVDEDTADDDSMPCEQCVKEKAEIVGLLGPQTEIIFSVTMPTSFLAYWELSEPLGAGNTYVPLFANGPPIPTETLVGTVILRT